MKTYFLAGIASLVLAVPAMAQSVDHSAHGGMKISAKPQTRSAPKKLSATNRPTAKTDALKAKPHPPSRTSTVADPHAGHDMAAMRGKPVSGNDQHAGSDMSQMGGMAPSDPHAGHDMGVAKASEGPAGTDLPVGNAPAPAPQPGLAGARYWGGGAMGHANDHMRQHHGGTTFRQVMFNLAEYQAHNGRDGYRWDGEAWIGGDINRFTLKAEGEGTFRGQLEQAEIQALFSRALNPYWNLQAGIRYDVKPDPSRTYATIGIEGLAPYWFEVEGALFLSDKGDVLARAEAYYDQRITQDLVLQPRAEANFAMQDVSETGTGSGLSDLELGLRLRYERAREFAPYVGISWEQQFGDTARFSRKRGDGTGGGSLVAGIRAWF